MKLRGAKRLKNAARRPGQLLSAKTLAVLLAASNVSSCGHSMESGEWGTFRFLGRVKGKAPLEVLAPISDRTGNLYTLYGAIGLPEVAAFVTRAAGGSAQPCALTKGDRFGAHGWVGFADDRAWYWSGEALVVVPSFGGCDWVLREDPHTSVELLFRAVVPWVSVNPSRSSLVALIQTPSDPLPFSALVDLTRGVTTNVAVLPVAADAVVTLGVGADPKSGDGVVLVGVTRGASVSMQALFFDAGANLTAAVQIAGAPLPEYGIKGNLEFGPGGKIMGLTSLGSLVVFDKSGGGVVPLDTQMAYVGLHRFNDSLWLVGTLGGNTGIRAVDESGRVSAPSPWEASERARAGLSGPQQIIDDREFPSRTIVWPSVRSGIGASPFLGAHSPWPHAPGTTLWVVAGPEVEANGKTTTSIAVAPVGIAYP